MSSLQMDCNRVRGMWVGFRTARALLTANNLGIFEITKNPLSSEQVSKHLNLNTMATTILLDSLVALGLLQKKKGQYQNTALTNRLLVKGSHFYQGDMLRHADTMWHNWSVLD
ncbi:MAG: hypothetical protein N2738_08330, partial [Thermodesulfovibrionales bacterium]|nr:hypothetical protein [Thermodesulfovibrionales bacterium]